MRLIAVQLDSISKAKEINKVQVRQFTKYRAQMYDKVFQGQVELGLPKQQNWGQS